MIIARPMFRASDIEKAGVIRIAAKREVDVPKEKLPGIGHRFVGKRILGTSVGIAVVVIKKMLDDIHLEPLVHIHGIRESPRIGIAPNWRWRLDRIHERENVGVIILLRR